MRKLLRFFLLMILLLAGAFVVFYFWAGTSRLSHDDYHRELAYAASPLVPKDTLTVMTYNIGYLSGMTNNLAERPTQEFYANNMVRAKEIIQSVNPDVVGFQEIDYGSHRSYYQSQMDELADEGGYAFGVRAVNWDRNYVPFPYWPPSVHFKRMLSGQAILSKYPVEKSDRIVLQKPTTAPFYYNAFYLDRLVQVARIDVGRPIIILNVHLEAFDEETRMAQARVLMDIYRQYAAQYPVILMGDFNARPPFASEPQRMVDGVMENDQTMSYFFEELGLQDAIAEVAYMADEQACFTYSSEEPHEKLDYILYDPDVFTPIEGRVVKEALTISDHLPLTLTFVFN